MVPAAPSAAMAVLPAMSALPTAVPSPASSVLKEREATVRPSQSRQRHRRPAPMHEVVMMMHDRRTMALLLVVAAVMVTMRMRRVRRRRGRRRQWVGGRRRRGRV